MTTVQFGEREWSLIVQFNLAVERNTPEAYSASGVISRAQPYDSGLAWIYEIMIIRAAMDARGLPAEDPNEIGHFILRTIDECGDRFLSRGIEPTLQNLADILSCAAELHAPAKYLYDRLDLLASAALSLLTHAGLELERLREPVKALCCERGIGVRNNTGRTNGRRGVAGPDGRHSRPL